MAMTQNATAVVMSLEASSWKSWLARRHVSVFSPLRVAISGRIGSGPHRATALHGIDLLSARGDGRSDDRTAWVAVAADADGKNADLRIGDEGGRVLSRKRKRLPRAGGRRFGRFQLAWPTPRLVHDQFALHDREMPRESADEGILAGRCWRGDFDRVGFTTAHELGRGEHHRTIGREIVGCLV